jgi:hypothetical protein
MVSLAKCAATVLLFSIVSANVGAAACLLDCENQAAPATVSAASCHDMDGLDSGGFEITPSAVVCHRDHEGLTAELGSQHDTASFRVAKVAHVRDASTSPVRPFISGSALLFAPQSSAQAPVGAPLPLRL